MKIELINFGYKNAPKRAHYNDAGADVYAISDCVVRAMSTVKIPLGFGVKIPDGLCGLIFPRSGLSSKGIACELPPIDSGYRGEIHAIVTNNSSIDYKISEGDRIGQLVIVPIVLADYVESIDEEGRGNGGFSSTGK